jgi:alpha-tubulin suppressor-like RCC1 family protein
MGRRLRSNTGKGLVIAIPLVASFLLAGYEGSSAASGPPPNSVVYRFGVVGNRGKIAQLERNRPTIVAGIKGVIIQIATSNSDGYALSSNGTVWAWGVNSYGELGDGQTTPYETKAVKVDFPAGVRITALANPMPFDAGLAIDSSGHAWGWGLNGDNDLCLSGLIETHPQQLHSPT